MVGNINIAFGRKSRYIPIKRNALSFTGVQFYGRRSILNIDSGFTVLFRRDIVRYFAAVHNELGTALVYLYRAKGTLIADDLTALHCKGTISLLHLNSCAIFNAVVNVIADFSACLQCRVGTTAVGDNEDCRAVF